MSAQGINSMVTAPARNNPNGLMPIGYDTWPTRTKSATLLTLGSSEPSHRQKSIDRIQNPNTKLLRSVVSEIELQYLRAFLVQNLVRNNRSVDLWIKEKLEDGKYAVYIEFNSEADSEVSRLLANISSGFEIAGSDGGRSCFEGLIFADKVYIAENATDWMPYSVARQPVTEQLRTINLAVLDALPNEGHIDYVSVEGITVSFLVKDLVEFLEAEKRIMLDDIFDIYYLYNNQSISYEFKGDFLCITFTSENAEVYAVTYARHILNRIKNLSIVVGKGVVVGDFYTSRIDIDLGDASNMPTPGVYLTRELYGKLKDHGLGRVAQQVQLDAHEASSEYMKVDYFKNQHNLQNLMPIAGAGQKYAYAGIRKMAEDNSTRFIKITGEAGVGKTNLVMNLMRNMPNRAMLVAMFRDINSTSNGCGLRDMFVRIFTDLVKDFGDIMEADDLRNMSTFLSLNANEQLRMMRNSETLTLLIGCLQSVIGSIIGSGRQVLLILDDIHFVDFFSRNKLRNIKDTLSKSFLPEQLKMIFVTRPDNEMPNSIVGSDVFAGANTVEVFKIDFFDSNGELNVKDAEEFVGNFFKLKLKLDFKSVDIQSFMQVLQFSQGLPLKLEDDLRLAFVKGAISINEEGVLSCELTDLTDHKGEHTDVLRRRFERLVLVNLDDTKLLYLICMVSSASQNILAKFCSEVFGMNNIVGTYKNLVRDGWITAIDGNNESCELVNPQICSFVPGYFSPMERRTWAKSILEYECEFAIDSPVKVGLLRELMSITDNPDELTEDECKSLFTQIDRLLQDAILNNQLHLIANLTITVPIIEKALECLKGDVDVVSVERSLINQIAAKLLYARFYAAVHSGDRALAGDILRQYGDGLINDLEDYSGKSYLVLLVADSRVKLVEHPFDSIRQDFVKTAIFHYYVSQDRTDDYLDIFENLIKLYFKKYGIDKYLLSYYLFRLGGEVNKSGLFAKIQEYAELIGIKIDDKTKSHDLLVKILQSKAQIEGYVGARESNEATRLICRVKLTQEKRTLETQPVDDRCTLFLAELNLKQRLDRAVRSATIEDLYATYLNSPEKITNATVFDLIEQYYEEKSFGAKNSAEYSGIADEMYDELCVPLKNLGRTGPFVLNCGLMSRIRWAELMTDSSILRVDIRHLGKILTIFKNARIQVKVLPKAQHNKRGFYQDMMAYLGPVIESVDLISLFSEPEPNAYKGNANIVTNVLNLVRDIVDFINNDGLEIDSAIRVYEWCEVERLIGFLNKVKEVADTGKVPGLELPDFDDLQRALAGVLKQITESEFIAVARDKAQGLKDPIAKSKARLLQRIID